MSKSNLPPWRWDLTVLGLIVWGFLFNALGLWAIVPLAALTWFIAHEVGAINWWVALGGAISAPGIMIMILLWCLEAIIWSVFLSF